jgi:hypothetical protein
MNNTNNRYYPRFINDDNQYDADYDDRCDIHFHPNNNPHRHPLDPPASEVDECYWKHDDDNHNNYVQQHSELSIHDDDDDDDDVTRFRPQHPDNPLAIGTHYSESDGTDTDHWEHPTRDNHGEDDLQYMYNNNVSYNNGFEKFATRDNTNILLPEEEDEFESPRRVVDFPSSTNLYTNSEKSRRHQLHRMETPPPLLVSNANDDYNNIDRSYNQYHPSTNEYDNRRDCPTYTSSSSLSSPCVRVVNEMNNEKSNCRLPPHPTAYYEKDNDYDKKAKCSNSNKKKKNERAMIEIEPGFFSPLRGADETFDAVKYDFYTPTECFCCSETIFCIQDADYILCPTCRVVSPVFTTTTPEHDHRHSVDGNNDDNTNPKRQGGVGLGFTYQDLSNWQEDIIRDTMREIELRDRRNATTRTTMIQNEGQYHNHHQHQHESSNNERYSHYQHQY